MRHRRAVVLGVLFGAAVVEAACALTGLDARLLKPLLYWVEGDFQYAEGKAICRPSPNASRLYELIPATDATCLNCVHPRETRYRVTRIHINSLGFRGRERTARKPPGVYRIVILGGSNAFGPSVSDEDTYAWIMQERLDRVAPGRFEVWNAGLNAYVMSQKAAYAEEILARYEPDLLVFSHDNWGRRPFMWQDPAFDAAFVRNPELFAENLPPPFTLAPVRRLHELLVLRSRAYRVALTGIYCRLLQARRADGRAANRIRSMTSRMGEYAGRISRRDFIGFVRRHSDVRVVLFYPWDLGENSLAESGVPTIALDPYLHQAGLVPEAHPPAGVYRLYARVLIYELHRQGLLPLDRPPPKP